MTKDENRALELFDIIVSAFETFKHIDESIIDESIELNNKMKKLKRDYKKFKGFGY